ALPLLVYGAAAESRPAPAPSVVPTQVNNIVLRVIRMDSVTFRTRWMPVYEMPVTERMTPQIEPQKLTSVVRYRPALEATAGTVPGAVVSEPPPRHRLLSARSAMRTMRIDICGRHNMRK